jgi:hypothetical protein
MSSDFVDEKDVTKEFQDVIKDSENHDSNKKLSNATRLQHLPFLCKTQDRRLWILRIMLYKQ